VQRHEGHWPRLPIQKSASGKAAVRFLPLGAQLLDSNNWKQTRRLITFSSQATGE
jgi:hypothetical protein